MTKRCPKCGDTKPVSEFCNNKGRKDGLSYQCKACDAEYRATHRKEKAEYRAANREKIAKQQAEYHAANRDKVSKQHAERYSVNREKIAKQKAAYRVDNREKISKRDAEYYASNRDRILKRQAEHRSNHREEKAEYQRSHRKEKAEWHRNRKANDIQFRLACNLRTRLWCAIRGRYKSGSAVRDLGCSIAELKKYLEKQFQPGMSWDNYGEWHIDHIKPLSSFNLENREELLEACHYTNLQPMWGSKNCSKGAKILEETTEAISR